MIFKILLYAPGLLLTLAGMGEEGVAVSINFVDLSISFSFCEIISY